MVIGLFLPVCECGNIPLAKRLAKTGFKPSEVITFMLAAPVVNPIVFFTTWTAFNLDPNIAFIRLGAGAVIALIIGIIFSYHPKQQELLIENMRLTKEDLSEDCVIDHHHEHHHHHEHDHDHSMVNHFRDEFLSVFKMLLLGAAIASIFQIVIPRDFFSTFADIQLLGIIALIVLAFVVSICSSIDAFFALSFVGLFNLGAIMAFLVFGPMIDIKALAMLKTIFKTKTLFTMSTLVFLLSIVLGLGVNILYKTTYS